MEEQRRLCEGDSDILQRAKHHFLHREIEDSLRQMGLQYHVAKITGGYPADFIAIEEHGCKTLVYKHPPIGDRGIELRLTERQGCNKSIELYVSIDGAAHKVLRTESWSLGGKNQYDNFSQENFNRAFDALQYATHAMRKAA